MDGAGCLPTPCEESGLCQSEAYVCTPTRALAPDLEAQRGHDAHGCVLRNCEDPGGPACDDGEVCLPERAPTDVVEFSSGCASAACAVGDAECASGQTCDPMDISADASGCVGNTSTSDAGSPSGAPDTDTPSNSQPGGSQEPDGPTAGAAACSRDSECASGYCVNERCSDQLGRCSSGE